MTATEKMLAASSFFSGLPPRNCHALASRCRERTARRDDCVFVEGTPGEAMYLLVDGQVQLVKTDADGREVVVRTLQPGDVFAEVVLQSNSRYPVTAIASAVGATPETLSRLIQRLRGEIGLKWEKGVLRLPDGFWDDWEGRV